MYVRCPHCRNSIELAEDSTFEALNCPNCGSTFGLIGHDETLSHTPEKSIAIAHFELVERLGVGAFGSVWRAHDTELTRDVALKMPRKGQLDAAETEKFLREARAAAQLNHPNIVSVHEVGRDGDSVYIVSDLVQGLTLTDWLTGYRPTARESAELCDKLARALSHAHKQGVVHRDLKPDNIMLDQDAEPYIMDFGLAKREVGEVTMTLDGQVLGTPAYMSPEQAKGEGHHVDARTDIYSLGVILFELLTGERPFRGNARMLLHQVMHEEAPSPCKLNSTLPRDLATICLRCLEKDCHKRFGSAIEVAEELRRFLNGEPIVCRPISKLERTWRWCRRNPAVAGLLTTIALVLLCGITISSYFAVLANRRAIDASNHAAKAVAERERANSARQDAESLVSYMVGDLRSRLKPAGRLDVMTEIGQVVTEYYDRRPETIREPGSAMRYAQALGLLSEIAAEVGHYSQALEFNTQALDLLAETPSDQGHAHGFQRERAAALRRNAMIHLDMKNPAAAASELESAVATLQSLEATAADSNPFQIELASYLAEHSVALARAGNEPSARRQLFDALQALAQAEQPAPLAGEPLLVKVSLLLQCDRLGIATESIPFALQRNSPRDEAERLLGVLIAANANDYPLTFKVAQSLHWLSPDIRGEAYHVADRLCTQLVTRDPSNQRWRELHAEIQVVMGYELTQLGQRDQALPFLETGLATLQQLADAQPENPRIGHRLAMAYRFMGWYQLQVRDYPAAQQSFRAGIEVLRPLISEETRDAGLAVTYGFLHIWLGEALRAPREKADAIRPALPVVDRIGAQLIGNEAVQLTRFQAHDRLSDFLAQAGDLEEAERQNRIARESIQEYRAAAGPHPRLRRLVAQGWRTRYRLLHRLQRFPEARQATQQAIRTYRDIVEKPELHARANYMQGECSSLLALLNNPSYESQSDFELVKEHVVHLEQYLGDIEADESRLPVVIESISRVWRRAAELEQDPRAAACWSHFLELPRSALALSDVPREVKQEIRRDALNRILSTPSLQRHSRQNGLWGDRLAEAIRHGRDLAQSDAEQSSHWKQLATAYSLKADWHRDDNQGEPAESCLAQYSECARTALRLEQQQFGPDDWQYYSSHHLVGDALTGLQQFAEAEKMLKQGFDGLDRLAEQLPSDQRHLRKQTAQRLAELYRKWGKPDQQQQWEERVGRL